MFCAPAAGSLHFPSLINCAGKQLQITLIVLHFAPSTLGFSFCSLSGSAAMSAKKTCGLRNVELAHQIDALGTRAEISRTSKSWHPRRHPSRTGNILHGVVRRLQDNSITVKKTTKLGKIKTRVMATKAATRTKNLATPNRAQGAAS